MQHPPIPRLPDPGRSRLAARLAAGLALGMLIVELQAADPKRPSPAKAAAPAQQSIQTGGTTALAAAAPPPPKPGLAPVANAATAARIAAARVTTLGGPQTTASDVPEGVDARPASVTTLSAPETSVAPKANAATAARVAALAKTLPTAAAPVAHELANRAADAIGTTVGTASEAGTEPTPPRRGKGLAAEANAATAARIAASTQPPAAAVDPIPTPVPVTAPEPVIANAAKPEAPPKAGVKSGKPGKSGKAAAVPVPEALMPSGETQTTDATPVPDTAPVATVNPVVDAGPKPLRRGSGIAADANAATAARIAALAPPAPVVPAPVSEAVTVPGTGGDAEPKGPRRRKGVGPDANAATSVRIAAMTPLQSTGTAAGKGDDDPDSDGGDEPFGVSDAAPAGKPPRGKGSVGPRANAATAARLAALAAQRPKPAAKGAEERSDRPESESPPPAALPPPDAMAPPGPGGLKATDAVTPVAVTVATSADAKPSSPPGSGGSPVSATTVETAVDGSEPGESAPAPAASQSGGIGQKSRLASAAKAATAARIAALALPNAVPLDLSRVFAPEGAAGLAGQEVTEIARRDTPSPASPGQTAKAGKTTRPGGMPVGAANPARSATAAGPVIKSAALPPLNPELLPPADAVSPAEAPMPPAERGAAGTEPSAPAESGREAAPVSTPPVPEAAAPAAEPAARPTKPGRGGKGGKATGKNGKDAARNEKGVSDADKDTSRAAKDAAKSAVPAATPGGEAGGGDKSAPEQKPVVETAAQALVLPRQGLRIVALPDLVGTPPVITVESPQSLKPFVQPGDEMTLLESMRRALYYSYAVRAAAARVETTKQTERTALARLLPRVDARMSAGQAKYDASARPTPPEWMLRVDRSVTAAQPLFNWSDYMTWRQQGALVSAEKERRSNTDSATALEAASAFLSVYQAQLVIEYGESYRELLADLERYVSERANSGATSLADADRVRARVANAQSILAEGRASLITSMGNLRRLVGALPERVTVGPLDASILPETLDGARTEATAANPDLLASRREVDAATLERRAVFGRFMPNVELEVSQLEFRNTSGQVGNQSDSRVLVVMNIPIFAGGGDLATVRALAAKRQEKEFNLGEKERKLLFDLESAFSVIESINPRLESTRVELESNLKVVAAFREQLFASNRSLLDVLDAYQRLYQSKVDLTTLLVNEARTKLQVAHLSGRLRQILPTVEIAP